MIKRTFAILLLFFSGSALSVPLVFAEAPLTLRDCYERALNISERVAISEADIQGAESRLKQAFGAILPHARFITSEFIQDDSATADGAGDVGTTLTRFSTPTVRFNAKQVIFSGLREYNALMAIKAEKRGNTAQWQDAKRKLFLDVANSFYTVLQLEKDLQIAKETAATLQSRLKESKERTRLGKARSSEQINTESDLAIQKATISDIEGGLAAAREVLAFFIGKSDVLLQDDLQWPAVTAEEDYYLKSDEDRPDIVAAKESFNASKSKLSVEKGGFLPTINAEANYYNYRVGFLSDVKWDAMFTLDFSIFEGGKTRAKVQEAKILLKQSQLELNEKRRMANLEIKKSWQAFTHGRQQTDDLHEAAIKGDQNYKASLHDYELGLINNLQLLEVLKNYQDIRRDYNRTSLQTKLNYLILKKQAGKSLP